MDDLSRWMQLNHDHILPLLGISYDFGPVPAIVVPWMHNGSLSTYLDKYYDNLSVVHKFILVSSTSNNTTRQLTTVITAC
jgi:hypothetical protein